MPQRWGPTSVWPAIRPECGHIDGLAPLVKWAVGVGYTGRPQRFTTGFRNTSSLGTVL